MTAELILNFPNEKQVSVEFNGDRTTPMDFADPLTPTDRDDIRWYLEVYGTQYIIDLDDDKAGRIADRLKPWGERLFQSAFGGDHAKRIFWRFYDGLGDDGGLITIDAAAPSVLSLPWELLCLEGRHLVHESPHISVRRRLTGAGGTGRRFIPEPKDAVHLLFVVSRPTGAGFIDPRADARAVMDALDENAPGRVTVEFLRPATLDNLTNRLKRQGPEHRNKPTVDILHFDGHGVFDPHGHLFRKAKKTDPAAATRDGGKSDILPDTGYLLFEDDKGGEALITAETLGDMLTNQKVALTVLSACQSGAVGARKPADGDPKEPGDAEAAKVKAINGVAARLTQAGLPGVIAMSHTVLVETTRKLFGRFYARLGDHMGVGAALDEARQHLYAHPERGEHDFVILRLYDWFLPALYQTGADAPLLKPSDAAAASPASSPRAETDPETTAGPPEPPEAGFQGRSAELWFIERAFLAKTRRVTVTGFGGQGKTQLAAEAGRWLVRTGMFRRCCFVGFAAFQGVDPVAFAVSTLSVALGQSLIDAKAAETALEHTPALVILDNLESLRDGGEDRQTALLDAAARWSRAGASRVLITTRQHRLDHPEFPEAASREHLYLPLKGLAEHDAVAFFAALWELSPAPDPAITKPPARHGLVELFRRVDFHPLSVSLLAYQLKSRKAAKLGERLESLLKNAPGDEAHRNLRVSLELSLERLPAEARKWLPGLGIFQGGAMEDVLLEVTGLGRVDSPEIAQKRQVLEALRNGNVEIKSQDGKALEGEEKANAIEQAIEQIESEIAEHDQKNLATGADDTTWPALRHSLETAGLIRAERLPGVAAPYLKFHPALAPALWERLPDPEKTALAARHRAAYYRLSGKLYHQDDKDPRAARAVARNELPNLLFAVRAALTAGEEDAVEFVAKVNRFLFVFGLLRDRDDLNQRAEAAAGPGSRAWFLAQSNKGEALRTAGRHGEAEAVFRNILKTMGETPTYERCITLNRRGRCLSFSGRTAEAAAVFREGIAVAEKLEQTDGVRRQTGGLQTDLANALTDMGDFPGARAAYEAALEVITNLNDDRSVAAIQGQLGTLAMREGNLSEAERRFQEALQTFRRLGEPTSEAVVQHQLGYLYYRAKQWDAAETAYRESARLKESLGNLAGAAETYNNLANTMGNAGRLAEAEIWHRKAMEGFKASGNRAHQAAAANNLAALLQNDPAHLDDMRLAEARTLADQALAIKKTLDPGASEIWKTYTNLAQIADKQGEAAQAREYRRLGREAKFAFAGTTHELRKHADFIEAVVAGIENAGKRAELESRLESRANSGWTNLVPAIRSILGGERDDEAILDSLDLEDSMIVMAILARLRGETPPLNASEDAADEQPGITQQQLQIAIAAALPALHPEARAQAEPLLAQLNQGGFTALAAAITRLWNGERDPAALCAGLDEADTAAIRLALHLIQNPEELEKLMGE